jgi:hypothetical protein
VGAHPQQEQEGDTLDVVVAMEEVIVQLFVILAVQVQVDILAMAALNAVEQLAVDNPEQAVAVAQEEPLVFVVQIAVVIILGQVVAVA